MKKKVVLLSLGGALALSTVAASIIVLNRDGMFESIRGNDVEYSITVTADDVTTSEEFESKSFKAYTDQLHNPVDFSVTNVKRNGDYVEFKGSSSGDGSLGNKTSNAIYAIKAIDLYFKEDNPATTMKIEWGWEDGGVVKYPYSSNIYSTDPSGYRFTFDDDRPDFFRLVNDDEEEDALMIKKFIITYGNECETQTSYGQPYKNVNKIKYKKVIDHWVVQGYADNSDPVADLVFEDYIDGLPVTEVAGYAFYMRGAVETVDFGGSQITKVGEYSFYYDSGITSVDFSDSVVEEVSDYAFYVCSNLEVVDFRNSSVTTIESHAFCSCNSLGAIYGLENIENFGDSAFAGVAITSVTLGENLNSMNGSTFYASNSITSVTFSDNCEPTYISNGAFNWCESIEYVHIGSKMRQIPEFYMSPIKAYSVGEDSVQFAVDADGVLYSNYNNTCQLQRIPRGTELTEYVMPDYVEETLGEFAEGCTSLESVTINNKIYSLSGGAFADCTNLTTVTFEETSRVSYIYSEAFENCSSLASITLPNSVTSISSDAFKNCTSLVSFTIPHNISTIACAFAGCSNIATIYYDGTVEEWQTRSIYKYSEWYSGISATVLTCTDDVINIEDAD